MTIALSPSKVRTLEACEFAFNYIYNEDHPKKMEPAFFLGGRLFHNWADTYGTHLRNTDSPFDADKVAEIVETIPDDVPFELYEDIKDLFFRWGGRTSFTSPLETLTEHKLALDENWEVVDFNSPDAVIRMIIDKVERVAGRGSDIIITDYKTSYDIKPLNILAGKTYAFGVSRLLKEEFTKVTYREEYVRQDFIQELEISAEDYQAIPAFYQQTAEKLAQKTEWPPQVNQRCNYCDAASVCPAFKAEVQDNDLAVRSQQDAVALAEKVYTTDLRQKKAKAMLKGWSDTKGDIVFGDKAFGPSISKKVAWDSLIDFLNALMDEEDVTTGGYTLEQIARGLSLSKSGLEKFLKGTGVGKDDLDEAVDKLVSGYGKFKAETKFTFHKADKD